MADFTDPISHGALDRRSDSIDSVFNFNYEIYPRPHVEGRFFLFA